MRDRSWKVMAFMAFVLVPMFAVSGFAGAESVTRTDLDRSQEGAVAVVQQQSGDVEADASGAGAAAGASSRVTVRQTQTNGSDGGTAAATAVLGDAKVTIEGAADGTLARVVVFARDGRDCRLDGDATAEITVSDGDREATFTNADGATIRAGQGRISITGSRSGNLTVPEDFGATANGTVVGATGIVCDGDRGAVASERDDGARSSDRTVEFRCEEIIEINRSADADQYDFSAGRIQGCLAREVIDRDKHKGELADTGGPGFAALVAALLLAGAGIWSVLSGRVE